MPVSSKRKVVLVVDDEPVALDLISINLSVRGYEVLRASDGNEALQVFSKNEVDVDMVLLDLRLPGIDGIQVCQRLRELSDVPIVIMSAMGNVQSEIETATTAGANSYLSKPFGIPELIRCVERHTEAPKK